jgi:hypothetical protein
MSEQSQEWTPERIQGYFGWEDTPSRIVSERLSRDFNAALAAAMEQTAEHFRKGLYRKLDEAIALLAKVKEGK